jgi:hypothetical protein
MSALATAGPVETAISTATTSLQGELLGVGVAAITVGAVVFALRKGWKFFKGMV